MRDERPALLSPDPSDLPLLFEAGRLLVRHANLEEAMSPLLSFLADRADLAGGIAALAMSDDGEVRVAAVADPANAALAGKRIELGAGLLGKALATAGPIFETESLAVPVVLGGSAVGALSFSRFFGSREHALVIASSIAALVAEALGLRRRLARAATLGDSAVGHVVPQTAEPLGIDEGWAPAAIVGRAAPMRELYSLMDRVAGTETTVLVSGESGTGKELVARALHERSGRAKAAFIAVNCAALPESVIESELFGHERGSFTGAQELRRGRFELADDGTLFLDEVGELSQGVQAKLLRVLQEGEFQRVGGSVTLKTDVRVIAATNRDLEREVAEGRFRADLFWRLNVFPLRVPPLRERRSDIVLLADYFAEKHGRRAGKPILRISSPGHRPPHDLPLAGQCARARELRGTRCDLVDRFGHPRLSFAAESPIRRFDGNGTGLDLGCLPREARTGASRRSPEDLSRQRRGRGSPPWRNGEENGARPASIWYRLASVPYIYVVLDIERTSM